MTNDESHGGNCDETNFQEQFQVYNYESHDDFFALHEIESFNLKYRQNQLSRHLHAVRGLN